jgi:hypothetical protein
MFRFTIRDMLWLILVVAMATYHYREVTRLKSWTTGLEQSRVTMEHRIAALTDRLDWQRRQEFEREYSKSLHLRSPSSSTDNRP